MAREKFSRSAAANVLGPSVTYHNLDGTAPVVTFAGVEFEDGEAVDLVEELGEKRAGPLLEKLAGNQFFDVDGSDADHSDARAAIEMTSNVERRKPKAKAPAIRKDVAKRIAKEDAEHEDEPPKTEPPKYPYDEPAELPDDVKTPDAPMLENNPGRARLPRSRS